MVKVKIIVDVNGDILGYLEDDKIKVFDKENFLRFCKEAYKYEDLNKLITVYF